MQKRPYGKTGYDVSALGMGCMRLPRVTDKDGKVHVDKEKAFEIIRYAVDHGVNYFDTAFTYHNRMSESILGEALAGGYREKVKIATKQPLGFMKTQDDIRRNLETTLTNLKVDSLDAYLIHNIQKGTWPKIRSRKIYDEYVKFRDEGLIKAIGFSYHGGFETFNEVLSEYPWDMCQIQQNLLDTDAEVTVEGIRAAGKKGCALVIMEPLRGGGLCKAPERVQKVYDEFDSGRTGTEWAFRYLLDFPEVSTILSGMTTLEQLKQNIEFFSKPDAKPGCLTDKEKDVLARAKQTYESIVTIPCTGCEYCLPCPNGVNIPGVFERYNDGMMFENFDQPRRSYMFAENAKNSAAYCVECGACEPKCPQNIPIIERLKMSHEALKGWKES